ncbi:efflux RND transporter permease subunit [Halocynthiibacter styelae]|uniref:Efflux RND transporter permease subunit n=1 Tax=Halocynthiibacter styelae TaxID=2761955 RepID=A0A8J7IJS0_9RHOB|nr:efflux RND transporter permease subunit [Paenihalocynthiibacter styelae]MBI1494468.1 efflux RND transporter permease subunit [Paenihalocynthiibacter styelae]
MTRIIDWAAEHARMVLAFIVLSLTAGSMAYVSLPKEGEPDIDIPALFVSVPFPGISAEDAEKLLVQPMETELSDLDGLKDMSGTAAEGYAGVALEFEFGWDKTKIIADVRDRMGRVEAEFPAGAETYTINEINFSEFPILIVNLTGNVPERTLLRVVKDLQDAVEGLEPVLEAGIAGQRDEMLEVLIDPLKLEAYNVTAPELIQVVQQNNQLIAAGEIDSPSGTFSLKIPSSFDEPQDVYNLPVKTNGERVVTLGDLAEINLTFEDRIGTARFNGENTVALQVVKRKGFNIIDTSALVRETIEAEIANWPAELKAAVEVGFSNDQSRTVGSMVSQLEGSVLTAIALVMIVILGALGVRSALLVGFAIPTSFLLCFVLLALMGITVSNIVMFGLILAVGMLVDGAIVVVEYADRRIKDGIGPMHAYVEAAKRMFWPIISSTATTLCAFLPMLFWPGVPGQFMGMLPVTLIFVLSASLVVALIYLPVMGGVAGRMSRSFGHMADTLRPLHIGIRIALVLPSVFLIYSGLKAMLNSGQFFGTLLALGVFAVGGMATSVTMAAALPEPREKRIQAGFRRNYFGRMISFISGNPVMPLVVLGVSGFFVMSTFTYFGANNNGVEFFVESEPEQAIVYVKQRGNLSLEEKDDAVRRVEEVVLSVPGIQSSFAFAGQGGLNNNTGGAQPPRDSIGQVQIELIPWDERPTETTMEFLFGFIPYPATGIVPEYDGDYVIDRLKERLAELPGLQTEILNLAQGPASAKPVHLRLKSDDPEALRLAAETARAQFDGTIGLTAVEDTLPLPGIDWEIEVDVARAGRYGADVATVGGMVQLVTRGILLDTMRVDSSDEEIEIRVRLPEQDRLLSTLDTLKVRTADGLVPLSNFISRRPVAALAQIDRDNQQRNLDIKAAVDDGLVKFTTEDEVEGETVEVIQAIAWALEDGAEAPAGTRRVDSDAGSFAFTWFNEGQSAAAVIDLLDQGDAKTTPITANERIAEVTKWLESGDVLPTGVTWEWTGDQDDQEESGAFLAQAFSGALGLMFIILLAQFNSVYNSVLVLLAVVLSTTGVLIGMLVMGQTFSIIMTGTGIVALAGIVVNNNIVLIDTYQEYARFMPRLEAISRTAQARIRPVLLTTLTTMAGLTPMMLGLNLDFINGGYSIDSPTALWWKQLATAVVFGLGIATVLTLVLTPSLLALRVWISVGAYRSFSGLKAMSMGPKSQTARDIALGRAARKIKAPEILWNVPEVETETSTEDEDLPVYMKQAAQDDVEAETPDEKPEKPGKDIKAAE